MNLKSVHILFLFISVMFAGVVVSCKNTPIVEPEDIQLDTLYIIRTDTMYIDSLVHDTIVKHQGNYLIEWTNANAYYNDKKGTLKKLRPLYGDELCILKFKDKSYKDKVLSTKLGAEEGNTILANEYAQKAYKFIEPFHQFIGKSPYIELSNDYLLVNWDWILDVSANLGVIQEVGWDGITIDNIGQNFNDNVALAVTPLAEVFFCSVYDMEIFLDGNNGVYLGNVFNLYHYSHEIIMYDEDFEYYPGMSYPWLIDKGSAYMPSYSKGLLDFSETDAHTLDSVWNVYAERVDKLIKSNPNKKLEDILKDNGFINSTIIPYIFWHKSGDVSTQKFVENPRDHA